MQLAWRLHRAPLLLVSVVHQRNTAPRMQELVKQRQLFWTSTVLPLMRAVASLFPSLVDRAETCRAIVRSRSMEKAHNEFPQSVSNQLAPDEATE